MLWHLQGPVDYKPTEIVILKNLIKVWRTSGVDGALRDFLDVLEELGFGDARVSQQQHVDVATQAVRAGGVLLLAAKQRQCDGRLDVAVPVDRRRDALADALGCADTTRGISDHFPPSHAC